MAYDSRMWTGDTEKTRTRRKSTRWMLLGGMVTLITYAVAALWVSNSFRYVSFFNMALLLLATAIHKSPFAWTGWIGRGGLASYDEFEREALLRSVMHGFRGLLILITVVFGWLCIASNHRWGMPEDSTVWFIWGATILLIGLALPVAFAEFLVPLPPGDDAEEEA